MGDIASTFFQNEFKTKKEVTATKRPHLFEREKYFKKDRYRKKNYMKNPMSEYLKQNQENYFRCISLFKYLNESFFSKEITSAAYKEMMEIKNILKNNFRLHDIELLNNEVDLDEDLYSRHGKFEEVKEEIDASSEDIEFNARRGFASGHFSPPSYHYEQHAYHPPAPPPPAPYKAVYEVDWTPLFLSLLPICLVLGTLLGLTVSGGLSTTSLVTSNSSVPSVTVNVNSSSTATSTSSGDSANNSTTSVLPIFVFTNGTFAIPLLTPNFGFTNIFGFGNFGGLFFGRSFSSFFGLLLSYIYEIFTFIRQALDDLYVNSNEDLVEFELV